MTTTTRPCASVTLSLLLLLLLSSAAVSLAAKTGAGGQQAGAAAASVYVVMVKAPGQGVNYKKYQMSILATALGSEEKAKQALIYSYKAAASGFAAKLTQAQVAALKKHPAVLQALPDVNYTLQNDNHLDDNHLN